MGEIQRSVKEVSLSWYSTLGANPDFLQWSDELNLSWYSTLGANPDFLQWYDELNLSWYSTIIVAAIGGSIMTKTYNEAYELWRN